MKVKSQRINSACKFGQLQNKKCHYVQKDPNMNHYLYLFSGFNPRWRETNTFTIRVPELALVRFTVKDHDTTRDDFIGYYCLPVLSIQDGMIFLKQIITLKIFEKKNIDFKI